MPQIRAVQVPGPNGPLKLVQLEIPGPAPGHVGAKARIPGLILATVTSGEAMGALQGGLAVNGTLMVLGAAASLTVSPPLLLSGRRSVKGCYSGTSIDSEETLAFSVPAGVRSRKEVSPLKRAAEAYERMMSGGETSV